MRKTPSGAPMAESREWLQRLRPTRAASVDMAALSTDASVVLERFGEGGLAWAIEVADDASEAIMGSMPTLAAESALARLFARGVRSSVLREMRLADGDDVESITDEGADVAREFVRRGLDETTLLENIRVGGAASASAFISSANELIADPATRAEEIRRLSRVFFTSLEQFSNDMSRSYRHELRLWHASQPAKRLRLIKAILSGGPADRRRVADVLHYDLDAVHIAAIAWSEADGFDSPDAVVAAVGEQLRACGASSTLVISVGATAAWGWGSVDATSVLGDPPLPPAGISAAVGQRHAGESGFRRSHREARSAESFLRLAMPWVPRVLRHADAELATLLAADLENAQYFVRRQLGPLALDNERMESLRTTLWLYLESERSVAAVAAAQFVARNTVTYRVKQAEQLIGRHIDDARLDIHTALLLARTLGVRVLVSD